MPTEIGSVKFGDPIFVPVAIANYGDENCEIPSLVGIPGLTVVVYPRAGGEAIKTNFDLGSGHHTPTILMARHVESSVLGLNIWHPNLSVDFATGEQFDVDVILPFKYDEFDQKEAIKKRFRFKISGSAFVDHLAYVDVASLLRSRWALEPDMIRCIGSRCCHLNLRYGCDSLALFGPLGWNVEELPKGLHAKDYGPISETPYYRAMRGNVQKTSALFRTMRCAELRELLVLSNDQSQKYYSEFIKQYRLAMLGATVAEYQFHVRALTQVPSEDFIRLISSEFSDILAFLDPSRLGGQSTTSKLTQER